MSSTALSAVHLAMAALRAVPDLGDERDKVFGRAVNAKTDERHEQLMAEVKVLAAALPLWRLAAKMPNDDGPAAPAIELEIAALRAAVDDAERVMRAIDEMVLCRKLDSRSPLADARLDYAEPGTNRLATIEPTTSVKRPNGREEAPP